MRVSLGLGLLGLFISDVAAQSNSSPDSVQNATRPIVDHILSIYNNGDANRPGKIPGLFPAPVYWWESGLAWDALVKYWALSGDDTVVDTITQALTWQVGPDNNYMPPNQTKSLGNDDQATWANAAMTAAEYGFPEGNVSWVQLAENVFNNQVLRWDDSTCGGGLRWQIYSFNTGYNYKNSFSVGAFAYLSARLALFTGNSTYLDWAQKAVDWSYDIGLIGTHGGSNHFAVFDGTSDTTNCSQINHFEWTYATGLYMNAAAYAVNLTSNKYWNALLFGTAATTNSIFTVNSTGVLYEVACQPSGNCNTDQQSFKAGISRALGNARYLNGIDSQITQNGTSNGTFHEYVQRIISASAQGASQQCSADGCGFDWSASEYDGMTGLGEDIAALEIMLANVPAKKLNTVNSTASGGNGTSTGVGSGTSSGSSPSGSSTGGATGLKPYATLGSFGALIALCLLL